MEGRYRVDFAAGVYWLVDMEQDIDDYRNPLAMSEVGAKIWNMMQTGAGRVEIADALVREYSCIPEEVREDVEKFEKQLETWMNGQAGK